MNIKFYPTYDTGQSKTAKIGKIVYIHPKKRFVLVEYTVKSIFGNKKHKLRECLKLVNGKIFN